MIERTCRGAFRKAGIYPFNPKAVLDEIEREGRSHLEEGEKASQRSQKPSGGLQSPLRHGTSSWPQGMP